jgi:predicted PurR-regulated permease PerM
VIAMMAGLILAFVVPFSLAIATIVENADEIASWAHSVRTAGLPDLPTWITGLPLVGPRAASAWTELIGAGPEGLANRVEPYARAIAAWFVLELGSFGLIALQFLLTLIMSVVLYLYGERVVAGVKLFFHRVAGPRGEEVVELSGQAIRGVAFGVVVTALVQSVLGGIGLAIVGIPFAGLLTALMFILAVAQVGAAPVLFIAVGWMYWQGETAWATGLLVWAIFVASMDNVLRPILIRRGGHLPLLLVFAGVIGGLVAFGLIGIFVGPLVLAVGYRLLEAWVLEGRSGERP